MTPSSPPWTRHLVYRSERTRTTCKLRLAVLAFAVGTLWLTASWWTTAIGRSLVCEGGSHASSAILIENFDPDYLLFERARDLRAGALAPRVLVPIRSDGAGHLNAVAVGLADVMVRISRIGTVEFVPIRETEPISLNAARDVRRFLQQHAIRSVIVVTPLLRSRRSRLVYDATLGKAGIVVHCEPVGDARTTTTWTRSWHGIQGVSQQWLKLQYYQFYVLPFRSRHDDGVVAVPAEGRRR